MDAQFHRIAPLVALKHMPRGFRDFLIDGDFTEEKLCEIANYPDRLDHDNIRQCAEIHHAHSYKMERVARKGKGRSCVWEFKWIDGDCLKTIEGLAAFAVDAWKEYQKLGLWPLGWLTRYALAKVTHYRIDALTYPHLHRGEPWASHHTAFECRMDRWIARHREDL